MNPDPSKLRHETREQNEQTALHAASQSNAGMREFSSVEEMIRYDASQTAPPEQLAERLNESIACEPKPRVPWWKRWFG